MQLPMTFNDEENKTSMSLERNKRGNDWFCTTYQRKFV